MTKAKDTEQKPTDSVPHEIVEHMKQVEELRAEQMAQLIAEQAKEAKP